MAAILPGASRLGRTKMVRTALFAHDSEATVLAGFGDDGGYRRGSHAASGHMRQEVAFLLPKTGHNFSDISNTRFEMVGEEAHLTSETPECISGSREFAGHHNSEAI